MPIAKPCVENFAQHLAAYARVCAILPGMAAREEKIHRLEDARFLTGAGRYTDDWQLRPEGWRCVSAHVSRF